MRALATALFVAAGVAALVPFSAPAQDAALDPDIVDITADDSIEWNKDDGRLIALGNAVIRRDDVTTQADRIIAYYRKNEEGKNQVWRIEMHGNVLATFDDGTLVGDDAAYEDASGVFIVTGRALRLTHEDVTLTARDSIEYWRDDEMVVARGDAYAVEAQRNVRADLLTIRFRKDDAAAAAGVRGADGAPPPPRPVGMSDADTPSDIERFDAFGSVRIETDDSVARSAKAVYDPETDVAHLSGQVKITRDKNQFNGDEAIVDFARNISQITGGKSRVRGLIVPD